MAASLPKNNEGYCISCYEQLEKGKTYSLECGHTFCIDCTKEYLWAKIGAFTDGIDTRCMQAGCNMKFKHSQFCDLLMDNQKVKELYWKQLCKQFTDNNKYVKWCPEPGCEYLFQQIDASIQLNEVECRCGTVFCFKCERLSHSPCSCEDYESWLMKASAESENVKWIMANTKKCPGCHKAIEKNQGCNHMTCLTCRHEFCWICMGPWADHGTNTGGYYKCNVYEQKLKDNAGFSEEEKKRDKAKNEMARY